MQEMEKAWDQSLGQEDPLEKEMVTHSSILSWEILWTEEPGGLQPPWGCEESDTTEWTHIYKESTLQCAFQFFNTLSQVGKKSFCLTRVH